MVAEKKLYDRIFYKEQSEVKLEGNVVLETAKKMDDLIRKALRKHERSHRNNDSDSLSPSKRSPSKRG